MKSIATAAALLCLALQSIGTAHGETNLDQQLRKVRFDQHLGAQIDLNLRFTDEAGVSITLGQALNGKPAILVPGYYACPMLCGAVSNGLVQSLRDLPWTVGRDFSVVYFSIDPRDRPILAARKKEAFLQTYARSGADRSWRMLTGDEASARALADSIGFHYYYDGASGQYAHPSGIVLLTPTGIISHYVFGVNFPPTALQSALHDAEEQQVGSPIDRLFLLCFHYQPLTGKYATLIMALLRGGAATLLIVFAAWIIRMFRREARSVTTPLRQP